MADARQILIIEDNADVAQGLKMVLEIKGYEVVTESDGDAGVSRARSMKPDVVICDIGLPKRDGFQVAEALRSDSTLESTTLIALSGYAREADFDKAKRAGFDHQLGKPPDVEKLEAMLDE